MYMKKLNITVVDQQIVNSYRKNRKKIPNNYVSFLKQNKIIVGKYSFNIGDVLEDVCYENNNADDNALNFLTIIFISRIDCSNNAEAALK
mgnify:CR=1 FL=1